MLEELVALAMIEDRRRRLAAVVFVPNEVGGRRSPTAGHRPLARRIAGWLRAPVYATVLSPEAHVEADAWSGER